MCVCDFADCLCKVEELGFKFRVCRANVGDKVVVKGQVSVFAAATVRVR